MKRGLRECVYEYVCVYARRDRHTHVDIEDRKEGKRERGRERKRERENEGGWEKSMSVCGRKTVHVHVSACNSLV